MPGQIHANITLNAPIEIVALMGFGNSTGTVTGIPALNQRPVVQLEAVDGVQSVSEALVDEAHVEF